MDRQKTACGVGWLLFKLVIYFRWYPSRVSVGATTISLATIHVNSLPSNVTSPLLMFADDSYHEDDIQINSE